MKPLPDCGYAHSVFGAQAAREKQEAAASKYVPIFFMFVSLFSVHTVEERSYPKFVAQPLRSV